MPGYFTSGKLACSITRLQHHSAPRFLNTITLLKIAGMKSREDDWLQIMFDSPLFHIFDPEIQTELDGSFLRDKNLYSSFFSFFVISVKVEWTIDSRMIIFYFCVIILVSFIHRNILLYIFYISRLYADPDYINSIITYSECICE